MPRLIFLDALKVAILRMQEKQAELVERFYAKRLGKAPIPDQASITVEPRDRDEVGIPQPGGKRAWMQGYYIKLTNNGGPLTNVLIFSRMKTTGASTALSEAQLRILRFNAGFGYQDKNRDVSELFKTQNLLATMPKAGGIYVPRLGPGDVLHIPLDETAAEAIVGSTLSLYCDQGVYPVTTVHSR